MNILALPVLNISFRFAGAFPFWFSDYDLTTVSSNIVYLHKRHSTRARAHIRAYLCWFPRQQLGSECLSRLLVIVSLDLLSQLTSQMTSEQDRSFGNRSKENFRNFFHPPLRALREQLNSFSRIWGILRILWRLLWLARSRSTKLATCLIAANRGFNDRHSRAITQT